MKTLEDGSYIVDAKRLETLASMMLEQVGVSAADASIVSDSLISADARGMNSHGVLRLPVYIRRLQQGGFKANSRGTVVSETAGTMLIDGEEGLGSVLTSHAMNIAISKAKQTGIAAVGIRNSNHNGENAYYVKQAISQDMIGIATTNGSPIMPVWGGKTMLTGPLPISIGVPTGQEQPILLDAALGMSSRGKILYYAEKGLSLPEGWLVDDKGRPTNDPNWIKKGGWILPIGGHKGWGLILACEILSGLLTGGSFGKELTNLYDDLDTPQRNGHFVIAINISSFIDLSAFKSRMDEYIRVMKASELSPGFEEILMPGEIEYRKENTQRSEGIKIEKSVIDDIVTSASGLGLNPISILKG